MKMLLSIDRVRGSLFRNAMDESAASTTGFLLIERHWSESGT